jgi:HEAT repeat protein
VNKLDRIFFALIMTLAFTVGAAAQARNFIPVDGASLKAKIDNAVTQGKANTQGSFAGRFWVGYQFEARPGVAIDFEVVNGDGSVFWSMDGLGVMFDSRYETRELGVFLLYETQRDLFTRAEVYNLRRSHEFSSYPVYWAGKASNEESLNYLKSIIDSPAPELRRLADRATFALALHDDARVESMLVELIKRPITDSIRSRAIYWLGYTPESQSKNALLVDIARNTAESGDARQQAIAALGMSRAPTTLPLLENLYETVTSRELKRRALSGIARNDNRDGAAIYLIRVAQSERELELRKSAIANLGRIAGEKSLGALTTTIDSDPETEVQKQAVVAIARRPKDEAVPILIRTARSHPKPAVRKTAIQMLGQTGDERAVAFFQELLAK